MNTKSHGQLEIPGRVAFVNGNGGLPKIIVTTKVSTAEIYLLGATELNELKQIVEERQDEIRNSWQRHFKG
jgi:hypothetical protein